VPFFAAREKAMRDEIKLDRILNDVAASALQATGATGVAIGLGREDAMICRAAAGLSFPDLGVRINTELGLTAAAIRRQMSQWCSDTESDSRVDVEVCRRLGVRSIIVVPVRSRDAVVGVFAIFSANPDAFSLGDLNRVKELAQRASEAIETTVANTAPQTIARPEHSRGERSVDVHSERTHGVEPWNYAVTIRRAIVLALLMLAVILIVHWAAN
jgi:GAF domain-containing protein